MSYADVIAGIGTRLLTVSGLQALGVLAYEPQSIQNTPACYYVLDATENSIAGQVQIAHYRVRITTCVLWQDNQNAEAQLIPFVNSIPAALFANPFLNSAALFDASRGWEQDAAYTNIAGTIYRTLHTYVWVLEKSAYTGGMGGGNP